MRDRTEGKQFEAMREGMRQLIYVLSHDMRNPLVNMTALLSEMRDSLQGDGEGANGEALQKDRLDTLEMLEESVEQLNRLVRGASDIYHCMFDDLECEEVALQELVARVVGRFSDRAGIEFSIGRLPAVWVDPLAMDRVISQLLDNAVQAMGRDGGVISVTATRDGMNDLLLFSDTSEGMPDDEINRIFEPFRSHSSGAGLAVVKALIEAHGGRVWCEPGPEKRSVFHISLPRRKIPG